MRSAPGAVSTFLAANNVSFRCDLVTVTLRDGTTKYRWTTADVPLTVGGFTYGAYGSGAPLVKRGPYRQSARLSIDTLDLTINGQGFTIGGRAIGSLGISGYFDGARVQIDHLIMPSPGDVSLGAISSFFEGRVAQVTPRGPDLVLRLKSELEALNILLPRFTVRPSCGNAVYDANCAGSLGGSAAMRASFTFSGTVSASTTTTVTTASAALTAKAAGYFALGWLTFTSGALNGNRYAVTSWSGTVFTLSLPLGTLPANGDSFTATAGCDHLRATCLNKFANLSQYRGYPHTPAPEGGA